MSVESSVPRFVVLFALDPASDRPAERLVLMNRFTRSGLGDGIQVLDHAFFPNHARVGFVLLLEAASKSAVTAALEPCAGVFTTVVAEPAVLRFAPDATESTHAVFGVCTPHDDAPVPPDAPDPSDGLSVRLYARLPEGGEISSVALVTAPTYSAAAAFAQQAFGAAVTETAQTQPMGDYVAAMRAMTAGEPGGALSATDPTPTSPPLAQAGAAPAVAISGSSTYTATPLDGPLIMLSSDEVTPFGASMSLTVAPPRAPITLSGRTYVWQTLRQNFDVVVDWSNANNLWIHSPGQLSGNYNWAYPIGVLPDAPGLDYVIGTSSSHPGVHIKSDLGTWLSALMTTDTYDAPWPEDSYTAGQLKAYTYIVDQLPGRTPPNKGTISEPEEIEVIAYPERAAFTRAEFTAVKNHLLLEIGHFATAFEWFGPNGIINVINTQISVLSANDLTEAAAFMSIPPQTSMSWSLDDIMGVIAAAVGVINAAGAFLSAVVEIGYAIAKSVMPHQANEPIQAAVGAIAEQLDNYLISMSQSSGLQHQTITSNWGRLSEFSSGVATGKISLAQFYGAGGPGSGTGTATGPGPSSDTVGSDAASSAGLATRSADSGPLPPPPQYLTAIKNGWLKYVYQQLFATQHAVKCQITCTDQPPTNPWNPSVGSFAYTWSLPCVWTDSKGNWHPSGYLVYDCSTDAPPEVMAQLFAPGSALDVNPVEFFLGFNGWPRVTPHYAPGYENINENVPWPPIALLGLPAWGALPG